MTESKIINYATANQLNNIIYEREYSATTSGTGAVNLVASDFPHVYLGAIITSGGPGFVFRRDTNYFTVFNNSMQPMANATVKFKAYFSDKAFS